MRQLEMRSPHLCLNLEMVTDETVVPQTQTIAVVPGVQDCTGAVSPFTEPPRSANSNRQATRAAPPILATISAHWAWPVSPACILIYLEGGLI
jgi:hypothetical protein